MKHVKKFEAIYSEDQDPNIKTEAEILKERIFRASGDAQEIFWAYIADEFDDIISGDFPPDATLAFDDACDKAVKIWVEANSNSSEFDSEEFYGVDNKQL